MRTAEATTLFLLMGQGTYHLPEKTIPMLRALCDEPASIDMRDNDPEIALRNDLLAPQTNMTDRDGRMRNLIGSPKTEDLHNTNIP